MTGALGTLALLAPAAAVAQEAPRTDPEVGSPAETVYGIPLEEARRDAAPSVVPDATVRSDTGVGSSARVPGRRDDGRPGREGDPERAAERRRERRSMEARAATRIAGEPSPVATATMLVLLVAIAAAGGVGAGRVVGPRARL